ncbi:MAG TPA: hypothetical protein EYP35_05220, partial [Desulfobacterales bacterium]|nr:hypothetical protein [Desulfobacterales bacterium]
LLGIITNRDMRFMDDMSVKVADMMTKGYRKVYKRLTMTGSNLQVSASGGGNFPELELTLFNLKRG